MSLSNFSEFDVGENPLTLEGEKGNIEAILTRPPSVQFPLIGIVCHPHPLHGGTMSNKVVTTIVKAWREMGICVLRFNFRGVGASEGEFDNGIGETLDLMQVAEWVNTKFPHFKLLLAGFSFGAFVSCCAASQLPLELLVSIAPPVTNFNFNGIKEPKCPWVVIQGNADEIISADAVEYWARHLKHKPHMINFKGVGHFFHGHLVELRETIQQLSREVLRDYHLNHSN